MAIPVREEQEWARRYPVPHSRVEDILLSLWNYPVAKTDLTPEHRAALKKFLQGDFLKAYLAGETDTLLFVRGHASDSGEAGANIALSRERAQKVARFLISEGFPASQVRAEWAGSSEPQETGASGYAAARNRRVDVVRVVPPVEEPLPPIGEDPPPPAPKPEPGFRIPKAAQPSSLTIDLPVDFKLPPIETAELVFAGKIGGTLKVKVDDRGGGWGGGLAIADGKLTAKFEEKLLDGLKGKINFTPPSGKDGAVLKVGGETHVGTMDVNVGLQTRLPHFVYTEFSFEYIRMPDMEFGDVRVSMVFKPTLKIEIGPGPAMLERIGVTAGGAGVIAAGTVIGTAVVIVGVAKVVDSAKQASLAHTRLIARRDGVAARVAFEIVGLAAEQGFRERRVEWMRTVDAMAPSFDAGVESVNALLRHGDREKLRAEWTAKYASDSQDFREIQGRVLKAVGYQDKGDEGEDPAMRL